MGQLSRNALAVRGFILVLFPLFCQLALLAILGSILVSLESEIIAAHRENYVRCEFQGFLMKVIDLAALSYVNRGATEVSKKQKEEVNTRLDQVLVDLDNTLLKVSYNEQERQIAEKMRLSAAALATEMRKAAQKRVDSGSEKWGGRVTDIIISPDTIDRYRSFRGGMFEILALEEARHPSSSVTIQHTLSQVKIVLLWAVALSTSIAILLGCLYANRVRKPVLQIMENSRLLAARLPLLPEMDGVDELSALDQTLHAAARALSFAHTQELALIENASGLICTIDRDGLLASVNAFAVRMLGFSQDQMVGKPLYQFTSAPDSFKVEELFRIAAQSSEIQNIELVLITAAGTKLDSKWACFWSTAESLFFCVAYDVTNEKRAAQAKQDFVDMVTHDLRSPLASMLGAMKLILAGAQGEIDEGVRKETAEAADRLEKLIAFVNDLLDFQKLESGKMKLDLQSCDLADLVSASIQALKPQADARKVSLRWVPDQCKITADKERLAQVVSNLIANAIKFSPAECEVIVSIQKLAESVKVSVTDEGPGVSAEQAQRIFDAFEQASESNSGVGLGLAICKLLIEAHGGSIGVRAREAAAGPGVDRSPALPGSTFWFTIPK